MDVTAKNFREALPLVMSSIDAADFVAIDGEFSGLRRASPDQMFSIMDTVEERYYKVANSVREFGLLQFGLSCFHYNTATNTYETATFSFYLLRARTSINKPNVFIVCSNSLRFLAEQNFNFNKLFKEGLPYLTLNEALERRDKLPNKMAERIGQSTEQPKLPDTCKTLYSKIIQFIRTTTKEMNMTQSANNSNTSKTKTTTKTANGEKTSSDGSDASCSSSGIPDDDAITPAGNTLPTKAVRTGDDHEEDSNDENDDDTSLEDEEDTEEDDCDVEASDGTPRKPVSASSDALLDRKSAGKPGYSNASPDKQYLQKPASDALLEPEFDPQQLLQWPLKEIRSPDHYEPPAHVLRQYDLKGIKYSYWKILRSLLVCSHSNVDATVNFETKMLEVRVFASSHQRNIYSYFAVMDDFYNTVGFSHVLYHLLAKGVPLVGHTCILDVFHLIDKCLEPLPNTLEEFKQLYKANISLVYDTKLIARDAPFAHTLENTSLQCVYQGLVSSKFCPKLNTMKDCASYSVTGGVVKEHDAGYDAFMTAVAFVGMVRRIDGHRNRNKCALLSKYLLPYRNRTFMMNICDMSVMHMAGEDEVADRRGVLVITSSTEIRYPLLKTCFPDLTAPSILSDNSENTRHFVLPSSESDKILAPLLIDKALSLCPTSIDIFIYSPNSMFDYVDDIDMDTHVTSEVNNGASDPNSPPRDKYHTPVPLTPRTAQLAKLSTLNVKSPEFTPSMSLRRTAVASTTAATLCQQTDSDLSDVHGANNSTDKDTVEEDYGTIVDRDDGKDAGGAQDTEGSKGLVQKTDGASSSDKNKYSTVLSSNIKQLPDVQTDKKEVSRTPFHEKSSKRQSKESELKQDKRGEKRKSGHVNDEGKKHQHANKPHKKFECNKSSKGRPRGADKVDDEDWQTVRNRNRHIVWDANKASQHYTNRFQLKKCDAGAQFKKREVSRGGRCDCHWKDTGASREGRGGKKRRGRREKVAAEESGQQGNGDGDVAAAAVAHDSEEDFSPSDGRELKRLKSVGTEEFSHLTLNSPTNAAEVFVVPSTDGSAHVTPAAGTMDAGNTNTQGSSNSSSSTTTALSYAATAGATSVKKPEQQTTDTNRRRRSRSRQLRRHSDSTSSQETDKDPYFVVPNKW